jgi:hypothetical protein
MDKASALSGAEDDRGLRSERAKQRFYALRKFFYSVFSAYLVGLWGPDAGVESPKELVTKRSAQRALLFIYEEMGS